MCLLQGLVQAVQIMLPNSFHRRCCHHILQNFQNKFKQTGLKEPFWEAAKAPNPFEFEATMRKIKDANVATWQYLALLKPKNGALHVMDPRVKCDHITSNFVESFNAWIREDRFKPPITMLEHIRSKIMEMIFTKNQIASKWDQQLNPDVYGKMKILERVSRHAEVIRSQMYEFEVVLFDVRVAVNLDTQKYDYNAWELKGVPYVHALACINFISANVDMYVHPYFSTEKWRRPLLE